MRVAPLAVTEEAQRLLRATRADFAGIAAPSVPGRGSGGGTTSLGLYDFEQVRNQSEYLRLVSIVEAYVDTCGGQQFNLQTSGRDDFVRTMAAEVVATSVRGWEERKRAFKTYHGVALGDCAKWTDIDAARQVRNSIAHGLGRLTASQQNGRTRRKLESMGVALRGNQLIVDAPALDKCVRSAIAFIVDVDRRLKVRT
jgi:hypothetical protein